MAKLSTKDHHKRIAEFCDDVADNIKPDAREKHRECTATGSNDTSHERW
jgi:hypothetical protein